MSENEEFSSRKRKYANAQIPLNPIEQDFSTEYTQQNDKPDHEFYKENTQQNDTKCFYQTTIHKANKRKTNIC
jgi:hypothetical protein